MGNFSVIKKSVDQVELEGKTYTCNGERIFIDGQSRWLYRTKKGLDCDILVCDDRYLEEPEFTHLTKLPGGCYMFQVQKDTHEYVDLGLPSGTLWATENIKDADGNELYFAWGETQGYTAEQVGKDKYFIWGSFIDDSGVTHHNDYKFGPVNAGDATNHGMTKYNVTDGKTELDSEDDAATSNWGSGWKMPTKEQFEELMENTTSAFTQVDGVSGMMLTSKANTNTLFFPAAGSAAGGVIYNVGRFGYYWSASLDGDYVSNAWQIYLNDGNCAMDSSGRFNGLPVRPVRVN